MYGLIEQAAAQSLYEKESKSLEEKRKIRSSGREDDVPAAPVWSVQGRLQDINTRETFCCTSRFWSTPGWCGEREPTLFRGSIVKTLEQGQGGWCSGSVTKSIRGEEGEVFKLGWVRFAWDWSRGTRMMQSGELSPAAVVECFQAHGGASSSISYQQHAS